MTLVLKGAHALQRDAVAERHVRRRDIDPELDAQRPAELQLLVEPALRKHVGGVASELGDAHLVGESTVTISRFSCRPPLANRRLPARAAESPSRARSGSS